MTTPVYEPLCRHCDRVVGDHADGKCLFMHTKFEALECTVITKYCKKPSVIKGRYYTTDAGNSFVSYRCVSCGASGGRPRKN